MDYMLSDWVFARDMMRERRPAIAGRAAAFAREIAAGMAEGDVDEVVVVAHSLGAVWMLQAVALALTQVPGLARGAIPLGLAGVGSSTLKIALHPAAGWLRKSVEARRRRASHHLGRVRQPRRLHLLLQEQHGRRARPGDGDETRPPVDPAVAHAVARDLATVPRQSAAHPPPVCHGQRAAYDFHMIACGPFRFADIVRHGQALPEGLGPDGSLARAAIPSRRQGRRQTMTRQLAQIIFLIGVVGWGAIRIPHEVKNKRKNRINVSAVDAQERILLFISLAGLGILPIAYCLLPHSASSPSPTTGSRRRWHGRAASFSPSRWPSSWRPIASSAGTGRRPWNCARAIPSSPTASIVWSGTPCTSAFFLWALAQVLLLQNWIAGPAGFLASGCSMPFASAARRS